MCLIVVGRDGPIKLKGHGSDMLLDVVVKNDL
jgi:hypothetical protein